MFHNVASSFDSSYIGRVIENVESSNGSLIIILRGTASVKTELQNNYILH